MKTPEELFNKAKNIKEPISDTDAEKMILGAKSTGNVAKPPSNKRAILLGILGTLSVIAVIAVWLYNSQGSELENSTLKNADTLKNNGYTTNKPLANNQQNSAQQKEPTLAEKKQQNTKQQPLSTTVDKGTATTRKGKPQNKKPAQNTKSKPNNTQPKNTKKETTNNAEKNKEYDPKQDDMPALLDTTVNTTTPKQQPPSGLLDSGVVERTADNTTDSSKKLAVNTADSIATNSDSAEAVAKLLKDTVKPPTKKDSTKQPFKRWYIKTDLLGYMYNNVFKKTMFYTDAFPAEFGITGNKYSLGIEYRFTKRFSLGLSANYGFINNLIEGDYVTATNNTYSFSETLSTFKGLVVNIEPRYYYLAQKHSSAFVAPFFSYGSMEQGVFFSGTKRGSSTTEYFTLAQTEGYSYGAGLLTGYKFEYKNFFVEPLLGIVVTGVDRNYQQIQEHSTVYWNNLLRIELSAGITF